MFMKDDEIKGGWKYYFEKLLNEDHDKEIFIEEVKLWKIQAFTNHKNEGEIVKIIQNGKASGPHEIPIEVCHRRYWVKLSYQLI